MNSVKKVPDSCFSGNTGQITEQKLSLAAGTDDAESSGNQKSKTFGRGGCLRRARIDREPGPFRGLRGLLREGKREETDSGYGPLNELCSQCRGPASAIEPDDEYPGSRLSFQLDRSYSQILEVCTDLLNRKGYMVNAVFGNYSRMRFAPMLTDGVVLITAENRELLQKIREAELPFVVVNDRLGDDECWIEYDNAGSVRKTWNISSPPDAGELFTAVTRLFLPYDPSQHPDTERGISGTLPPPWTGDIRAARWNPSRGCRKIRAGLSRGWRALLQCR